MKTVHSIGKLIWVDIESPNSGDIADLIEDFDIDPLVAEELTTTIERPKVEAFKKYLYLVLHFPSLSDTGINDQNKEHEVDFLIFKNTLITVHDEHIPTLHEFSKTVQLPNFARKLTKQTHAGHLFIHMMRHFYTHIAVQLDDIAKNLRIIEDRVFNNHGERMIKVLSEINRKLLHLKKAIRFHGSTVERFHTSAINLFGVEYTPHVEHILFEYNDLAKSLAGHKEVIDDLWKTNDTLFSSKTSDTMRKLTALSFITFPLSLVVAVIDLGGLTTTMDHFLLALLGLCGVTAVLVSYLQHNDWL